MKRILVLLVLVLAGCYDDDSTRIESDNTAHVSSELTTFMKSISLHNASYDDVVDNSSCFSIEFPYQVTVNNELRTISHINDLNTIYESDDVEIIYPVSAVFYNYDKHQMTSAEEYDITLDACEENFNISSHSCLDFQYPIIIKMFNQVGNDFHSMQLDHDQDIYTFLDNLHETDVYEIEYPIIMLDHTTGNSESITSNLQFETLFESTMQECQ